MKVYGVYSGCIFEGGGVASPLYLDKNKAIQACKDLFKQNKKEDAEMFKDDPKHKKKYKWRHDPHPHKKWYWQNGVDCIMLVEYDVEE